MKDWHSKENLERAWKYVKVDLRDDFIFDVVEFEDIKSNLDHVISSLSSQIETEQYYPAPLLRIGVPKNDHSVRPGTVIPVIDLLVLYAIIQQLAPLLDNFLTDSAYAYRINPKSQKSGEHLFKHQNAPKSSDDEKDNDNNVEAVEEEIELDIDFPYNWFANWREFHESSKQASEQYEYVAVTDITAYFENISLDLLREILKEKLNSEHRPLIDRLFRLLEFWDWTPSGNLPQGIGLIQGNDVSSFLSNLYLLDLDEAMLKIVSGDVSKYYRYVDDIKLFTSDQDEARRGLVELEKVLRTLNLNVQSAKTKIVPADEIYDPEAETWLEKMNDDNPDKVEHAVEFFESTFEKENIEKWQRAYSRCLSIFNRKGNHQAVGTALDLFLNNPSNKLLRKNFGYLKNFVAVQPYSQTIVERLSQGTFTFPYHKALIYRLAAYSRENDDGLKQLALQEAINPSSHWFCRMASLFCLGTFSLSKQELAQIAGLINTETNPQVMRAVFVVLCQHSGEELRWVLNKLTLFNAPHQDYLRRYFFKLFKDKKTGKEYLKIIKKASVRAPNFIQHLHKLDLLKANSDVEHRKFFKGVIEMKIHECDNDAWSRLITRLNQIYEVFILRT